MSPPASLSFKGQATKHTTVKTSIAREKPPSSFRKWPTIDEPLSHTGQ